MNKDFEKICCSVCGKRETEIIARRGAKKIPIYVSICPNCGLVYLNPRWKKKKYVEFYAEEYKKWRREENVVLSGKTNKKFSLIFERIKDFISHKPLSILDIGSAKGIYLEYFKRKFPEAYLAAIEPMPYCQKHLIESIGANLLSDDAESNWQINVKDRFDLIIMRMVLEHLLNPLSALKKVSFALSKQGLFYLSVPNMLNPKMKGSLENYWFRAPHTYYFSRETLLALIANVGLEPVILHDSTSEMWGIFKKGNFYFKPQSVYEIQKRVIKKFRIKYFIFSLKSRPKQLLKKILPAGLKNRIKKCFIRSKY